MFKSFSGRGVAAAVVTSGLALTLGIIPVNAQEIEADSETVDSIVCSQTYEAKVTSGGSSEAINRQEEGISCCNGEDSGQSGTTSDPSLMPGSSYLVPDDTKSPSADAPQTDVSINERPNSREFDELDDAKATLDGWATDESGNRCYYKNGTRVVGETEIDGSRYLFDKDGIMLTGWQMAGSSADSRIVYYGEDGAMLTGEAFLSSKDGSIDERHWYYLDDATGAITYGWKWVDAGSKWVYYQPGAGWMTYGESFNPCGNQAGDASHWYYFDDATGAATYGWKWVDAGSKWVYYQPGAGWMTYGESFNPCGNQAGDASHWYYFDDATGATTYGWKWLSDSSDIYFGGKKVYYDTGAGWMIYGWQNIGGTWNYFNKYSGGLCSSTNAAWSAAQWLNWSGSSSGATNNTYVMVDKNNLRCMTFERDGGVWVPTHDFLCSVAGSNGNHGAGTVEGFWHLGLLTDAEKGITNGSLYDHGPNGFGAQIDNFLNSGSSGLTWSGDALAKIEVDRFANTMYRYHYVQDQGIHSTVGGDNPDQLGKRNTDGCVRLSYGDCRWIFECVPMYTTIRIYSDVRY